MQAFADDGFFVWTYERPASPYAWLWTALIPRASWAARVGCVQPLGTHAKPCTGSCVGMLPPPPLPLLQCVVESRLSAVGSPHPACVGGAGW